MPVFAQAIDSLFADPHLAQDAVYTPANGAPVAVRVIARRPDLVSDFAERRVTSPTALFDLRVSEVANPRPGDRLEMDGATYLVQGEPVRDAARLVWTLDTRPA